MGATAFISSVSHRRIARARAWLKARAPAEELLIIGASLDAANELARGVAQTSGSAFGWHRFTLPQLAAVLAAPMAAARGVVTVGRLGVHAIVSRTVHALSSGGALGRYARVANAPGFFAPSPACSPNCGWPLLVPIPLGRWLRPAYPPSRYEAELADAKLMIGPACWRLRLKRPPTWAQQPSTCYSCRCCCSTCRLPLRQSSPLSSRCAHLPLRCSPRYRLGTSRLAPNFEMAFVSRSKIWINLNPDCGQWK